MYFSGVDITPTGSLRRRRSRVLSEEDDGSLMDFLRSSGHDNVSRERKPSSYGSLGKTNLKSDKTTFDTTRNSMLLYSLYCFHIFYCYRC